MREGDVEESILDREGDVEEPIMRRNVEEPILDRRWTVDRGMGRLSTTSRCLKAYSGAATLLVTVEEARYARKVPTAHICLRATSSTDALRSHAMMMWPKSGCHHPSTHNGPAAAACEVYSRGMQQFKHLSAWAQPFVQSEKPRLA
jgi:hypothetical protein